MKPGVPFHPLSSSLLSDCAQLCPVWFLLLARSPPIVVVQGGAPPLQPVGETENKKQRKIVMAASSWWLPCFPASYTAVLCSLSPGGTSSWKAIAELATCWEARGFVCFVQSRTDKGKVAVLKHAAGMSDVAQGSAGLLQPVEGRCPLAQSCGWWQPPSSCVSGAGLCGPCPQCS